MRQYLLLGEKGENNNTQLNINPTNSNYTMTHYEKQSSKELRAGMGEGLVEDGRKSENVVALSADVKGSVKMDGFVVLLNINR